MSSWCVVLVLSLCMWLLHLLLTAGTTQNATNIVVHAEPANPTDSFIWYPQFNNQSWSGDLFASADTCQTGNKGIHGLDFNQCMELCLVTPQCQVVAYWPSWLGGPSACFAKDATQVPGLMGTASSTPIATPDQGAYFGKRI